MEKDTELNRPLVASEPDDEAYSIDEDLQQSRKNSHSRKIWRLTLFASLPVAVAAIFLMGVWTGRKLDFEQRCAKHTSHWCKSARPRTYVV